MHDPASSRSAAAVVPVSEDGVAVQWQMPLDVAEAVITMLSREMTERAHLDQSIPADLYAALLPLRDAIVEGYDRLVTDAFDDCSARVRDPLLLTAPLVMVEDTQQAVTVLLPGAHTPSAALDTALTVLDAEDNPAGPELIATVSDPGWLLLHACADPAHVLHLQAPDTTTGSDAILVTRVDFTCA